ncbi:MAG: Vitamin B12 dependent methionine synthase activation subunit [Ruminococcaceae bacterium]|nr:Vitamin B12 dependent methionine synthase activation subunit [Oscillospiraceae bacterium]
MSTVLERGTGVLTDVEIPKNELFMRLGTKEITPETKECVTVLLQETECRYCYVRVPVTFLSSDRCVLGDFTVTSHALGTYLRDCKECFLLAATIGSGADRLIARLGITSPARQFITDAAASALVEGVCDRVCIMLSEQYRCRPRFSPGFGDFLLDYQPELLRLIGATKQIGLALTDALFLTPSKSVTAVIGICE